MSSAFGGSRTVSKSPEKGVFPLDHLGECKQVAQQYLACVEGNDGNAEPCIKLAKTYLECRMDRNLMARQELSELGLGHLAAEAPSAPTIAQPIQQQPGQQ